MNPSMELLENVLFSIVLNHNTLDSGNVVNSYLEEKNEWVQDFLPRRPEKTVSEDEA